MGTELMDFFGNANSTDEGGTVDVTNDFRNVTYDGEFKNVFRIKRILAIVIRETIDIYADCSVDEVVGLIGNVEVGMVGVEAGNEKIDSVESHVSGEGKVTFDILVSVGIPAAMVDSFTCKYVKIKLDMEMQRDFTPGYILSNRGLYYCARMLSDQLGVINKDTNYDVLVPVYSIWVVLVGKTLDIANKVLRYQLRNTGAVIVPSKYNSAVAKMDAVTGLINMYFICIDKTILETKQVKYDLDDVVEFVSLLFAGQFDDSRVTRHDIKFRMIIAEHRKELSKMANYLSEIERVAMESEARGKVKWEARGIIRTAIECGLNRNGVITMLLNKLDIPVEQAEEYYEEFSNQC